jgi:hypothetical protein
MRLRNADLGSIIEGLGSRQLWARRFSTSVEKIALRKKVGDFSRTISPPLVDISHCLPSELTCGCAIRISRHERRDRQSHNIARQETILVVFSTSVVAKLSRARHQLTAAPSAHALLYPHTNFHYRCSERRIDPIKFKSDKEEVCLRKYD